MRPPQPMRSEAGVIAALHAPAPGRCAKTGSPGAARLPSSSPGLVEGCASMPTLATTASFFWSNSALQRPACRMKAERRAAARRLDRQQVRLRDVDARKRACEWPRNSDTRRRRCARSACSRRRCRLAGRRRPAPCSRAPSARARRCARWRPAGRSPQRLAAAGAGGDAQMRSRRQGGCSFLHLIVDRCKHQVERQLDAAQRLPPRRAC